MNNKNLTISLLLVLFGLTLPNSASAKTVIASNGAGAALIENTLEAATLAAARGVNYLEIPVVISADNQLLVFDHLTLDTLTNVAELFPGRSRAEGGYYVIDFTLSEIRQLRLNKTKDNSPGSLSLGIPTLKEELSLLKNLEQQLGREIGLMVEIKSPWFFSNAGKDPGSAVVDMLLSSGYGDRDNIFIQSFDPEELQRLHSETMPKAKAAFPLIQMIDRAGGIEHKQQQAGQWQAYNYEWLTTNTGLRMIASYASAIGLPRELIDDEQKLAFTRAYIDNIHGYELQVFVYQVNDNRIDDNQEILDKQAMDFAALLDYYYNKIGIDGIYTDSYLEAQHYNQQPGRNNPGAILPSFFSDTDTGSAASDSASEDATVPANPALQGTD